MGELIEVKFPLSSQNAPRGMGFVPYCDAGGLLSLPEASLLLRGYQAWQGAHLAHLLLVRVTP